ncbi:Aspartic proteinase nepenthesin-1, partial [Cucurbita argyrosperma subsp. sororia]
MYTPSYRDRSFTYGDLATEKITIGSFKLNDIVIGCGYVIGGSFDRLNKAIRRSISRADALFQRAAALTDNTIESPISPGGGEYVMSVSIGTPPVAYVAIADTGSDPAWTQCMPCKKCYPQAKPIFDPKKSTSFRHVPCTSNTCQSVGGATCGDQGS